MERKTRISRLVRQFLEGRFSASTEERVQRWLADESDTEEKEAASQEFWQSLETHADTDGTHRSWQRVAARAGLPAATGKIAPLRLRRAVLRRAAGIAAAVAIPLMVAAGGLVYYTGVVRPRHEAAVEAAGAVSKTNEPLLFEGASVGEIFTALERRFGVTITAAESFTDRTERYTVKFTQNESLEDILDVLGDVIGEFEYTKTGNNITIIAE